jgi:hypothetical protein
VLKTKIVSEGMPAGPRPSVPAIRSLAGRGLCLLLCLYFGEVVLGGPGSWSGVFFKVDVRKVFFFCVCLSLTGGILTYRMVKIRDVLLMLVGMMLFAIWMFILPTINDTPMAFAMADGIPILSIFLITLLFKVYSDHTDGERHAIYVRVCRFVFAMSILTALVHLGLCLVLNAFPDRGFELLIGLKLVLDNQEAGSIYVGPMADGSIRVFWISSLFLIYGLYRALWDALQLGATRIRVAQLILFLGAIVVTQTRSIFIAVPAGLAFAAMVFFCIKYSRVSLYRVTVMVLAVLFSITFIQLMLVSTDIMALLGLAREASDDERGLQVAPLLAGWLSHFVVGGGFGFSVSYIRSVAAPFSYEFSIVALYMKIGIAGLMLAWSYFIYIGNALARTGRPTAGAAREYAGMAFLIFVYFFVFNTNPYLSNSVGVAIFLLISLEAARLFKGQRGTEAQNEE